MCEFRTCKRQNESIGHGHEAKNVSSQQSRETNAKVLFQSNIEIYYSRKFLKYIVGIKLSYLVMAETMPNYTSYVTKENQQYWEWVASC